MEVSIRAYKEKDYLEMLEITMELWNLKMEPYTKRGFEINKNIINDTGTIPKRINEGILVAEVDEHIAGVVHLDFKGKKVSKKESLSVLRLILKYGLSRLLKVRDMGIFFEPKVEDDELHIHGIVVSSKYRSMGIGSKLFDEIDKFARKQELKKITLEVLDTNTKAIALYKRLGFEVVKQVEFNEQQQEYFKSKSHIYMMKKLKD